MAGIGIRYLEMARRLPRAAADIEVVVVTPGDPAEVPTVPGEVRAFARGGLAALLADCDGAVAQGQLANDLLLEVPTLPCAIDLYDPWLVENLHYFATLGLDPYRNDHATWMLQLSRGDFFLCSSEEQRAYYLGLLTALGRVNPERVQGDPDLQGLIAEVPFGIPQTLPPHQPVLPELLDGMGGSGERRRLLFGGLYDWYDPWTLLRALEGFDPQRWQLLLIRNPNPEATPQKLWAEVEAHCRRKGWWGDAVIALDWIPAERRYDLLRDVDLMVAPHRPSLETRLSLRTRFLDALAADCPAVTSEGGTLGRLLTEYRAGWVVPAGDATALATVLDEILDHPEAVAERRDGARRLARRFAWDRVLEPLVAFCRQPRQDPTKARYAFQPGTVAPPDALPFRARRWLHRHLPRFLTRRSPE